MLRLKGAIRKCIRHKQGRVGNGAVASSRIHVTEKKWRWIDGWEERLYSFASCDVAVYYTPTIPMPMFMSMFIQILGCYEL
jgi:hypothetical protein